MTFADARAEALEQQMAALVDSADDAIVSKTLDGIITSWNPGAERLLGYAASQIIGQSVLRLIPDDRREEETAIIARIKAGERIQHFETVRRRRDGTLIDVSLTVSPIRNPAGDVIGASKIMRDITERRLHEEALHRANLKLAQINGQLEDFVYTASHDLRSPLNGVNSVVQWILEDDRSLSCESRDRLMLIRGRIERMKRLLNDIRDYAQTGQFSAPSRALVRATELVADVVSTLNIPPGFAIHADDSLSSVRVARMPLEQIFHNLINNAIKHHDNVVGRVDVSVSTGESLLRFSVVDDGPGIPEEYRDAIFEMFKTLKPRDAVEGSGIGLALVRKIVASMGGRCGVRPAVARGSEFWFDWPRHTDGAGDR